jgi:hypothetical protein
VAHMKQRPKKSATRALTTRLQTGVSGTFGAFASHKPTDLTPPSAAATPIDDGRLTILKGPQFDALVNLLDNPPEPSEQAREEVARARLWK